MSLDKNLFTLNVMRKEDDPTVSELVDTNGVTHYRKIRVPGSTYVSEVYEPLSNSHLATVTAPSSASKAKTVELHNPSVPVELKFTGLLTFKWGFKWEEHEFEWRREECYMLRKPDPPVLVAITKEPPGRIKPATIQILDYNLNRFDIHDRKGLEILILTALLSFQDSSDDIHQKRVDGSSPANTAPPPNPRPKKSPEPSSAEPAPPVKSGLQKVVELQNIHSNEVHIYEEEEYTDYARYCVNLLERRDILFIAVHSTTPTTVPKVLQVVEQAIRLRHQVGEDDNLHQYVSYNIEKQPTSTTTIANGKKGPRIIKLDDDKPEKKGKADKKEKYKPPENVLAHLSKIPLPELQPKVIHKSKSANFLGSISQPDSSGSAKKGKKGKDKDKDQKAKDSKKLNKNDKGRRRSMSPPRGKDGPPPIPSRPHVRSVSTNDLARGSSSYSPASASPGGAYLSPTSPAPAAQRQTIFGFPSSLSEVFGRLNL